VAGKIVELFGYLVDDQSKAAQDARQNGFCPFIKADCTKFFHDRTRSGVCTIKQTTKPAVICCPNRLYGDGYQVLRDVAKSAFKRDVVLINASDIARVNHDGNQIAVFGKRWGKELRLPRPKESGNFFVDWILARIGLDGKLAEFVAVEVQSIDTTGSYRGEWESLMSGKPGGENSAGFNWANVSKRILSQLIYKGNVLRREPKCQGGLFFVCPTPVYENIRSHLGGELQTYPPQPGSITFRWYDRDTSVVVDGVPVPLEGQREFTTTIEQLMLASSSAQGLPPSGVYEQAIEREVQKGVLRPVRRGARALASPKAHLAEQPARLGLVLVDLDDERLQREKYIRLLPVYSLEAAAGYFGQGKDVRLEGWLEVDARHRLNKDMFVARVVGPSMEPRIHDGDLCLFRRYSGGSRDGLIVLAEHRGIDDPETGGSYSVKKYTSTKAADTEGSWKHTRVRLEPINKRFKPIEISNDSDVRVLAEFVEVVG
jgi:SOS-response transcriptional repressor LexA